MKELEYSDVCRDVVEAVAGVAPDEEVLVVTDPLMVDVARPIAAAARATGAATSLLVKPRLAAHNVEPPAAVGGAMREADVVFDAGTHDLAHTDARRNASASGTRVVLMRGVSEATMMDEMDTDYDELRRVTRAVARLQTEATTGRLTSERGTDLTLDLTDSEGFPIDDGFDSGLVVLPAGKSAITPAGGDGTVVVDGSIDDVGLLDDPVELTVSEGRVTDIEGEAEAERLRDLLAGKGECARNLAEGPSVGTNPDVSLTGNQATDKKKRGTAHVAVGDDVTLGGSVECDVHLDMTIRRPTVALDGFVVVDEGRFREAAVLDRAGE
ncbi:MAG: aminopeptidase [Haloferacaceae archaeon]